MVTSSQTAFFLMETRFVEHKKSFGKEVIISLVAFANTEGGSVVVGVDDSGKPCGLEVGPETVQRYLNEIKVATYPQLTPKAQVAERDGKQIVIFEIPEFPVKPVAYKGRYYKRVHNSNHLLTLDEIVGLQQRADFYQETCQPFLSLRWQFGAQGALAVPHGSAS